MEAGNPYAQDPCQYLNFFGCHFSVLTWRIVTPIFLSIGLSGNIMSLVVFSRKRMRNTTTSVYLRFLAVLDLLVLLTALLREMILYYTYVDVRKLSDFSCRFHIYISSTARLLAIWLLCIIAVDRLILIKRPIWAKSNCTRKLSLVTATSIIIILFVLNSHMFVFFKRSEITILSKVTNLSVIVGYKCSFASEDYKQFHMKTRSIIILVLFSALPVICLIFSSVVLLREISIRHQNKQVRRANVTEQDHKGSQSVIKMLISICVFFVVLYVPAIVFQLIGPYMFDMTVREEVAKKMAFTTVLSCLYYSNNTLNFLLYCVSGKLFRKEISGIYREVKTAILKRLNIEVEPLSYKDESLADGTLTGKPATSGISAVTKVVTIVNIDTTTETNI